VGVTGYLPYTVIGLINVVLKAGLTLVELATKLIKA